MTEQQLTELFHKHTDSEGHRFDNVEPKLSLRADLHAFMILDKIAHGKCDMVSSAEHDQIWIEVTPEQIAPHVTEDQIIELIRCDLLLDKDTESFYMFV